MSQENVEIAKRALAAVRRGDYGEAGRCFHADAEWHNTSAFPGQRIIVGTEAIVNFVQDLFASFTTEGERAEAEKLRASGDRVVVGVHSWGLGKSSGVPVDVRWAITFTLRDGKIARADVRGDYAEALGAAGIEE